jgi:hypothetical protein
MDNDKCPDRSRLIVAFLPPASALAALMMPAPS